MQYRSVMRLALSLGLLVAWSISSVAQQSGEISYSASLDTVKYQFGPAEPVAHLKSGDILRTNTRSTASATRSANPLTH
jgi:hypothetical protein